MFKKILFGLVIVGLSSCNVLDQEPQQSLPSRDLETLADFENALTGAYDNVQSNDGDNSGHLAFMNDIITDDVVWGGSFPTYVQVANHSMTSENGSIASVWNGAYIAINSANLILDQLDNLDADQAAGDNIRGQALFIRALQYYYLVDYFSLPWGATADNSHLGVPLQLSSVTSPDDFENPSRATVAEVYDQILQDLEAAEGLISNTVPNRATNDAVIALQARIALIQERWSDAATLAEQVIDLNSLSPDVVEYFEKELSEESIFEIQHTTQDVVDPANTSLSAVYHPQARGDITISAQFKEALEAIVTEGQLAELEAANLLAVDTRVTELMTPDTSSTLKYEDNINEADNVPVLRQSEMILTRAEALVEAAADLGSVPQEAYDLLNEIRTRAIDVVTVDGAPNDPSIIMFEAADFANKQELIDAILLERRVELAFEGHRKTDLQRRKMNVGEADWDAPEIVFPIPQTQIDSNKNIDQNEGYGS